MDEDFSRCEMGAGDDDIFFLLLGIFSFNQLRDGRKIGGGQ
jgi:hypothetical protein